MRSIPYILPVLAWILAAPTSAVAQAPAKLELNPGDSIAIVGNTLPDRMQHSGWLETLIQAAYPNHNLAIRTLAAAGDEVTTRYRSENFGTPDQWLEKSKADVIFAFFGFNESFKGPDGVAKFKDELTRYLQGVKAKNYSGKGAPRVVLFSPIAHEDLKNADYPDGKESNFRLKYYVEAMAEVAKANGVQFVDLFSPSQKLYGEAKSPLTINGIHLKDAGDKALAPEIFQQLFGTSAPTISPQLNKLRQAVLDKNWEWHQRYRTVDGYNVYGGRSQLAFPKAAGSQEKIRNFDVMQEEMVQRDAKTANRDKRIWAVAKGGDLKVDDNNLPPVTQIVTNKPGANPDGSHKFVSGEDGVKLMKLEPGLKVNLFADEQQFPELAKGVQMAWDTKNRLWVAAWPSYPERQPTGNITDKLIILEDTNGDGKADKCTTFVDNLNSPTGFQFYNDGVLLMQAPDLWFLKDTDGDGKADFRERILMGMDSADSHHTTNAMCLDPGGATYLSDGVFHRTQVETLNGPERNEDGAIYRFEPRTNKFETYIAYGFANPHGRVFTRWGYDLVTDATGNNTYFGPAISGHLSSGKHSGVKQFWDRPSRPCPATGILSSGHFPEDWQGDFLNINVISFQGIWRVKVAPEGSGLHGTLASEMVTSTDPNFRPICISVGPDGAIYFSDWHNPIIGHMQHHIRDPNRDHIHGRIYRITYDGRPLLQAKKIAGQPIPALLDLLKASEDNVRERAKTELGARSTPEVMSALATWIVGLDKTAPEYEHHMAEALWVHQWHNVVNEPLLKRQLHSPNPDARAAATRVLCYWRDRVPSVLELLKEQATDPAPQVRLQAVRAASFFDVTAAVDVALTILKQPTDYYLDYVFKETMRQLEPVWKKALNEGAAISAGNPKGINFLLKSVRTDELLAMPKTPLIYQALVFRAGVPELNRLEALDALAKQNKSTLLTELLAAVENADDESAQQDLSRILTRQSAADLKSVRDRLVNLASTGKNDTARQATKAALITAEGSVEASWAEAAKSAQGLLDFVKAVPFISDPKVRSAAHDKLKPLLTTMPASVSAKKSAEGRFVRIELPRNGTLTLAEVEILSDGKNVARGGKATQSSTAFEGAASRAIDGNTSGTYGARGQTHTEEGEKNPWWEVDLNQAYPIEAITVYNRSEANGEFVKRLNGFTLTVLDGDHREIFKKTDIPAPTEKMTIELQVDPTAALRRAAIRSIVSTGQEPEAVFSALASLISKGDQANAAAQAMMKLPRSAWSAASAETAANSLVAWAKTVPTSDRTAQDYVETVQIASELASLLSAEKSQAIRKQLRDISVPVFVLKTVREQMRYDQARLVVEAGKAFEIIFENEDALPHNLVVTHPGKGQEVGTLALTMAPTSVDKKGRAYLPGHPSIINATKLLEAGQKETMKISGQQEGAYDWICTFPGHSQVMWGKIVVTKDVDAYLQAHPQPESLPPTFSQPTPQK